MSKFYKTKEVEELLKISNMTLQRWRNSGKIPYIHHFSMKIYSNRRKKLKSFVKELGDSNE